MFREKTMFFGLMATLMLTLTAFAFAGTWRPVVEVEEAIATCEPPNNGAGPLWAYGAPMIARYGNRVFVSVMETGEGVPPLSNTRWRLFGREDDGAWELLHAPDAYRNREPCPLGVTWDGRLYLSVNPSTQPPGTKYGATNPHLIEFSLDDMTQPGKPLQPKWAEGTHFTDHSYRGFAVDGPRGELLLLNIHAGSGAQFWSYRDANGNWARQGVLEFPIRSCYPQVALKDGAAHVLAIGDIVEPVEEWREYKREQTGRSWDYVFRRLFYAWTPNIRERDFFEPIEVENLDATAGHIGNMDLWIDPTGAAHLLYRMTTVQSTLMRDRFFPDVPIVTSLVHTVVRDGEVVSRETIAQGGEGASGEVVGYARFQVLEDGTLGVVTFVTGTDAEGRAIRENRFQVLTGEEAGKVVRIPLEEPFRTFFTATERGGSKPSNVLDLFGIGNDGRVLRYARVRLRP